MNGHERNSEALRVRLTEDEQRRLVDAADKNGVSQSRFVRRLVRESTGCGPDFFQAELRSIYNAVTQLRSIGLNLNQITRKVNAGEHSSDIDPNDLAELSEHIGQVAREITKLAKRSRTRGHQCPTSAGDERERAEAMPRPLVAQPH